jgi:uncharacterized protein DUF4282
MSDFWAFRKMVTPVIIEIVFWVGVITCIIAGLSLIGLGIRHGPLLINTGLSPMQMELWGALLLLFGPLAVRVYCEILIVIFRINETLTEIKHVLERKAIRLD